MRSADVDRSRIPTFWQADGENVGAAAQKGLIERRLNSAG